MLAIEIDFLTGRYVATAYNTRGASEWPPHPARLFSALAATHFSDAAPLDEERTALEWLELQGAPTIRASAASHRDVVTAFVPVNDSAGVAVLPEQRTRQPRSFPSVTPAEPRVVYFWPDAMPTDRQRLLLDQLLSRLVRLGHSSSLVTARLVDRPISGTWWPAEAGEVTLRTVATGQLASLERAYKLHEESEPRVLPARFHA